MDGGFVSFNDTGHGPIFTLRLVSCGGEVGQDSEQFKCAVRFVNLRKCIWTKCTIQTNCQNDEKLSLMSLPICCARAK